MAKKSMNSDVKGSIVIPFLKGAKSIEDKVSFLRSVQNNTSLSDYDRSLVGRTLRRYTTTNGHYSSKYFIDNVYGDTHDYVPTYVSDKFKKMPMHQIRGLRGKVRGYISGCRDSGISGEDTLDDLSLRDKVSFLINSNRIADAMELLGTMVTRAYENGEDNLRSYDINPDKTPRNRVADYYFKTTYGPISKLVNDEETRRKQEIKGRLDSGYYNQSRGLKKYLLQDSSRNFGRTQGLRNYLAKDKEIQSRDVGKKVGVTMAVAGLGASIFFIGSNLTGNVVGSLSVDTTNLIGVGSFLIGIVGAMLCFRKK